MLRHLRVKPINWCRFSESNNPLSLLLLPFLATDSFLGDLNGKEC